MKKFLAYFIAVLFIGAVSLAAYAFTQDPPKKEKAKTETCSAKEQAGTHNCAHHKAEVAEKSEAKACCAKDKETAEAKAACANHKEEASATGERKACCKKQTETAEAIKE